MKISGVAVTFLQDLMADEGVPPMPRKLPSALKFHLIGKCSTTKARAATLHLPHGAVPLPIFMPVATQASLKGITPEQLEATGCRLCLNNTYHLGLKPGQQVLEKIGGAHRLQGWKHNILTDSGGLVILYSSNAAHRIRGRKLNNYNTDFRWYRSSSSPP